MSLNWKRKIQKICDLFTLCGMWAASAVSSQVVRWLSRPDIQAAVLCCVACLVCGLQFHIQASREQLCERNVHIKGRRGTAMTSLHRSRYCLGIVSVGDVSSYFLCFKADLACISWRWLCFAEEVQQGVYGWPRCVIKSCCTWRRRPGEEAGSEKHERTDKWGRRDGDNRRGLLSETFTM